MVTKETFSISGFGGGYEAMCQRMLWRGVAYLAEVRPPTAIWHDAKEYPGIVGVLATGSQLKELEDAIIKPNDDVTGAMHHFVMNHLRFIHENGELAWREEMRKHRDGSFMYEWDGQ